MRKILATAAIVLLAAVFISPIAAQACMQCNHIFNSWFCFPGYPGRENCVDTLTECAMSGAFCDQIIVVG